MLKLLRHNYEYLFFYIFLLFLLFLGDGKGTAVDVVGAAGILCLFVICRMLKKSIVFLPKAVNAAWIVLLLYIAVRTVFSDSVGYSIIAMFRWVIAYLVFIIFFSVSSKEKQKEVFGDFLLWFGVVAVFVSLIVTLLESLGRLLPGMNLLYPAYGHNHIANIIVFIFPLALNKLIYRASKMHFMLLLFLTIALLFSFARGAWILLFFYLCYVLVHDRPLMSGMKRKYVLGLIAMLIAFSCIAVFISNKSGDIVKNQILKRQIIKASASANRIPYWLESVAAIKKQPLLGYGPGTFFLLSKRFQEVPNSYSWYAHSFPLEIFAEMGVVGIFIVFGLGMTIGRTIILRARFSSSSRLRDGVVLTLAYSMYELNLNFLIIWFLLWASLGVLSGTSLRLNVSKGKNFLFTLSIIFIVIFYVSALGGEVVGFFPKTRHAILYLAPYQTTRVLSFLDITKNVSQEEIAAIELFHKMDPEVLARLAENRKPENMNESALLYEKAVSLDPKNMELFTQYIDILLEQKNTALIARKLSDISGNRIDFTNPAIFPFITKNLFQEIGSPTYLKDYLAKLYYFLGLSLLNIDRELARTLWTLARDSAPNWGYFHVELADLEYQVFFDKEQARNVLANCQKYIYAKQQCMNTNLEKIGPPGGQKASIRAIPLIYTENE